MKVLLGCFLFLVLLTTGGSIQCEVCVGIGETCSGPKQDCGYRYDACATILTKMKIGDVNGFSVVKSCFEKSACKRGMPPIEIAGGESESEILCSKASPSSASLLLALSTFLLMKMLV